MDTIIFKKVKKDSKIIVKHNRKIKAKIFIKDNGYQLIINGLSWEKSSLNECYLHIIEIYSNMLNMLNSLGFNNEIQII